ncbi:MauE/DoxX family redox-associated membrane protein [Nonomuraea sp. NPDC059194]|uniref:MauE/DoxX family redox-associated membrane protein n=1 Tax=Nonomuraea sp. NPDC059194 TaxID=3346764 RepID=UPI0036932477
MNHEGMLAALALPGALLLLYAATRRLVRGPRLAGVLRAHRLLPSWLVRQAMWLEAAEALAGAVTAGAWLAGSDPVFAPVFAAGAAVTAALQAGFAGYLVVLLRRRGRVPCGCLDDSGLASPASAARGLVLALAAVPAALGLAVPPAWLGERAALLAGGVLVGLVVVVVAQMVDLVRSDPTFVDK